MQELDKMVGEICENAFFMDDDLVKEKNRDENKLYISFSKLKKIIFSYLMHDDGWIPVEERLPEEKKTVLVQWEKYGRYINITLTYLDVMWLDDAEEKVFETINGVPNGKVIAWRPLPEPYSPERSNNHDREGSNIKN